MKHEKTQFQWLQAEPTFSKNHRKPSIPCPLLLPPNHLSNDDQDECFTKKDTL